MYERPAHFPSRRSLPDPARRRLACCRTGQQKVSGCMIVELPKVEFYVDAPEAFHPLCPEPYLDGKYRGGASDGSDDAADAKRGLRHCKVWRRFSGGLCQRACQCQSHDQAGCCTAIPRARCQSYFLPDLSRHNMRVTNAVRVRSSLAIQVIPTLTS